MKERDFHNLIEQQNPEVHQRIWERVSAELNIPEPQSKAAAKPKVKSWVWAVAAVVVCLVTLSIVLPLTLGNGGSIYCTASEYTKKTLSQTLKEYSQSHKNNILYVDWYDVAEERTGEYAHMNNDEKRIVFLKEFIFNGDTGEELTLWITDNRTNVDVLEGFGKECQELSVKNVKVEYSILGISTYLAKFEYKAHIYYLQLKGISDKERMVEIIETMLP